MDSEGTKNLKIELGNRNSNNSKTVKLKSNKRQSGMGVEHRKNGKSEHVCLLLFSQCFSTLFGSDPRFCRSCLT